MHPDSMPNDSIAPGQILAGKYRIEQVLGSGGMGVVVAARHLQMKHRVALKLMQAEGPVAPEAVARLLREAQHATSIQSEHVVRVTDLGALPNGRPYLVMEYLEGTDFGQLLLKHGPMPQSVAVDYLLQALAGVAEAHALGSVHRDLKPTNLFLTERADGTPLIKVLDFGISKAIKPSGATFELTRTSGALMGSPLYMAPEQIRSAKLVDQRADVWSLGVILQQFLTGQPPFTGEGLAGVLAAIIADPPRSVREHSQAIAPGLEQVIFRCLEKDRGRRFQNVGELAAALAPFASDESRRLVRRIVATVERGGGVLFESAPGGAAGFAGISSEPGDSWRASVSPSAGPSASGAAQSGGAVQSGGAAQSGGAVQSGGAAQSAPYGATATASATASAWVHPTAPAKRGRLVKGGVALMCLGGVVAALAYKVTNTSLPPPALSANPVEIGSAPPRELDPGLRARGAEVPATPPAAPEPTSAPSVPESPLAPSAPEVPDAPSGATPRPAPKSSQGHVHAVPARPKPAKPPASKPAPPTEVPDVSDLINERH